MRRLLYLVVGFCLFLVSYSPQRKNNAKTKNIEILSNSPLILKPYRALGLLYSCTPDDDYPTSGGGHSSHSSHGSHSSHYSSHK